MHSISGIWTHHQEHYHLDIYLQWQSLKHFKAMNSKKHGMSNQSPLMIQRMAVLMMMTLRTMKMARTWSIQTTQVHQIWTCQARLVKYCHCPPNCGHTKKGSFGTTSTMSWPILGSLFRMAIYLPLMQMCRWPSMSSLTWSSLTHSFNSCRFFMHCLKTDLKEYPKQNIRWVDAFIPGWQSTLHEKLI